MPKNEFSVLRQIVEGKIRFAGNKRLKIYGTLTCSSGKKMKKDNRVFFATEQEAIDKGYAPAAIACVRNIKSGEITMVPGFSLLPRTSARGTQQFSAQATARK